MKSFTYEAMDFFIWPRQCSFFFMKVVIHGSFYTKTNEIVGTRFDCFMVWFRRMRYSFLKCQIYDLYEVRVIIKKLLPTVKRNVILQMFFCLLWLYPSDVRFICCYYIWSLTVVTQIYLFVCIFVWRRRGFESLNDLLLVVRLYF